MTTMEDQQDIHDVASADDGQLQDLGAVGGEAVAGSPTLARPSLDLSRFLPSMRGGGEGAGWTVNWRTPEETQTVFVKKQKTRAEL